MNDQVKFSQDDFSNLPAEEAMGLLIDHAARINASDLFLFSNERHVEVAVRQLGTIKKVRTLARDMGRRLMVHLKVLANISIDESRRPMDGRFSRDMSQGQRVDVRVDTIPTLHGEDFTLRLLVRDSQRRELSQLGLTHRQANELVAMLNSPGGMILVTGPTSSGKTTTLYACLNYLNNGARKINTIEDPLEYSQPGVRQSEVNVRIGVDFPDLLRSVLRQSPDVIMIGEVRDGVTARTAVRAANSGHLVLATLHAPIAAAAMHSLLALDVHPYFLANSLRGVIAQRLVRTLCPNCKQEFDEIDLSDTPETFQDIESLLQDGQRASLYVAPGCEQCGFSGYTDRIGVFEVLNVSRGLRTAIAQSRPAKEIQQQAIVEGMVEFRRSGLLKVAQGVTTIEEIMRSVPAEFLGIDDEEE